MNQLSHHTARCCSCRGHGRSGKPWATGSHGQQERTIKVAGANYLSQLLMQVGLAHLRSAFSLTATTSAAQTAASTRMSTRRRVSAEKYKQHVRLGRDCCENTAKRHGES